MTCLSGTSSTGTAERSDEAGGRPFTRFSPRTNPAQIRRGRDYAPFREFLPPPGWVAPLRTPFTPATPQLLGRREASTSASTLTGFGTSPSFVMYSIDFVQAPWSIAPKLAASPSPFQAETVALSTPAWRSGDPLRSGTAAVVALRPASGSDAISRIARR